MIPYVTYLILVGRVEWNFANFLILFTIVVHVSNRQLDAFEQGGL